MKREYCKNLAILIFASAMVFLSFGIADAQIRSAGGGWYVAGYGTVYGSFGQANASQNLYKTAKAQTQRTAERNALIKKWGLAAVEKAEREAKTGSSSSSTKTTSASTIVVSPPPIVRNHGIFRPDATVDTGKALADALADTPEEKALIKQIYTATKDAYEKEATARGWKNNIAAGLTFFTVTAMTVYRDAEEPGDDAVSTYFKAVNSALDEMPEFATMANKEKQGFNNMLIGFSGLLLAGYSEGKQSNNAETLASYKKLAGMLIELVLKTDPENITVENNQIVMK